LLILPPHEQKLKEAKSVEGMNGTGTVQDYHPNKTQVNVMLFGL